VSAEQKGDVPGGVALQAPPAEHYGRISQAVDAFAQTLAPEQRGGAVGIATTKGVNLAIVQRVGGRSAIVGWVGKSWGEPIEGGLAWKLRW